MQYMKRVIAGQIACSQRLQKMKEAELTDKNKMIREQIDIEKMVHEQIDGYYRVKNAAYIQEAD